jgi:hypothetical protein
MRRTSRPGIFPVDKTAPLAYVFWTKSVEAIVGANYGGRGQFQAEQTTSAALMHLLDVRQE